MKKEYVIPEIEIVSSLMGQPMMEHSYDWADAKEATFEEEKEDDPALDHVKNIGFPDIWGDEEED